VSVSEDKAVTVWASGTMARVARRVGFMKKDIYFAPIKTDGSLQKAVPVALD